jgi:hypothetical protein
MALKLTKTTPHGFVAEGAYLRVEEVKINQKQPESSDGQMFMMKFILRSYKQNNGSPFFAESQYSCVYNIEGNNPIAQAYEDLKKLPEFAGAQDC